MSVKEWTRTGRALALALSTLGMACLDAVPPGASAPSPPPPVPPGIAAPLGSATRPSISAALHLHGLSNHGASSRAASIAWHTQQYAAGGVDLIWWTDHADFYFGRVPDFRISPVAPTEILPHTWLLGVWGPNAQGNAFLKSSTAPVFDSATGWVHVVLPSGGDSTQTDTVGLSFGVLSAGSIKRAGLSVLSRPLVGEPTFTMRVDRLQTDTTFPLTRVLVPLAWHPRPGGGYRQVLEYRFGPGSDSATRSRGDTLVVYRGWASRDSVTVAIQPATEAALLPDGLDNTTDEYRVQFVVARSSAGATLSFSLPTVVNARSAAVSQMPPAVDEAHAVASAYGIRAIWGLELGTRAGPLAGTKWQPMFGAGGHMSVFLPQDIAPELESSLGGTPSQLAATVKSLAGVTAIAHPFGTSSAAPVGTELDQRAQAQELGAFLVQNRTWGADLVEVGTIRRGLVGLRAHLDLLDYLWASGFPLCGTGVTDSHGGEFLRDPQPGTEDQYNFVTWIGGVDRSSSGVQLVAAMRSCNLSFGDPFYTRGGLWIDLHADDKGHQRVTFDVAGVSPSAELFLYDAEIDSTGTGHAPVYRRFGQRVGRTDSVSVGGCKRGFVRVEAWAGERPIAFSNPVVLAPDATQCAAGVAPWPSRQPGPPGN